MSPAITEPPKLGKADEMEFKSLFDIPIPGDDPPNPPKEGDPPPDPKDIEPPPPPPEGKKKKTRDEQFAEIRDARDAAVKEADELKKKLAEVEPILAGGRFDKLRERLKSSEGKDDDEALDAWLSKTDTLAKEHEDTKKKIEEKDARLRFFDITASEDWEREVAGPRRQSEEDFLTAVCSYDENGEMKNPEWFHKLNQKLVAAVSGEKQLIKPALKGILDAFVFEYREKTGDHKYAPVLDEVWNKLIDWKGKVQEEARRLKTWERDREAKTELQAVQQKKQTEEAMDRHRKTMRDTAATTKATFQYSDYDGIFTKDEIVAAIDDVDKEASEVVDRKRPIPPYAETIGRMWKLQLFDKLVVALRETKALLVAQQRASRTGLPPTTRVPVKPEAGGKGWQDEAAY